MGKQQANKVLTRRNGSGKYHTPMQEIKPQKCNGYNRYKKLPALQGKFNEPFHEGLYRFQDVPKFLEIGTGAEGIDEKGHTSGMLSTSFKKSSITEELNVPIEDCTDKLVAAGKLHDFGALGRWTVEEHERFVIGKFLFSI